MESPFGILYRTMFENEEEQNWRQQPKKLTPNVALYYLELADGDRKEAKKLAAKDGFVE